MLHRYFTRTAAVLLAVLAMASAASAEGNLQFTELENIEFWFSSGVGAWYTELKIAPDGSFTGEFHDSDMGDAEETYPDGTVYGCVFRGHFLPGEWRGEYCRTITVTEIVQDEGQVPVTIEDGIRYVTVEPYGLKAGHEMMLYKPGMPISDLPEGAAFWFHLTEEEQENGKLSFYGIYDLEEDCGFRGDGI